VYVIINAAIAESVSAAVDSAVDALTPDFDFNVGVSTAMA